MTLAIHWQQTKVWERSWRVRCRTTKTSLSLRTLMRLRGTRGEQTRVWVLCWPSLLLGDVSSRCLLLLTNVDSLYRKWRLWMLVWSFVWILAWLHRMLWSHRLARQICAGSVSSYCPLRCAPAATRLLHSPLTAYDRNWVHHPQILCKHNLRRWLKQLEPSWLNITCVGSLRYCFT